jgi:hypothetical protein
MAELLRCPRCKTALSPRHLADIEECPACGTKVQAYVFPAWFKGPVPVHTAQPVLTEKDSSCYYHKSKQAVVPCDACGRFLCALCDCDIQGQHYCPGCVSVAKDKGRLLQFERSRTNHDSVALTLAILSTFLGPLALALGPAAILWALWFWNRPGSLLPRTKARSVMAVVIGLASTCGWGFGTYKMIFDGGL